MASHCSFGIRALAPSWQLAGVTLGFLGLAFPLAREVFLEHETRKITNDAATGEKEPGNQTGGLRLRFSGARGAGCLWTDGGV